VLPQDHGAYYPSLLRVQGDKPADVAALADVQRCTECHAEAVHEWGASAHAHASFDNPWYRASVDDLRQGLGYESSQHCAGCHDPLLLLAGKMTRDVKPSDPLASAGVTCLVCHSVQATTSDGNASFSLSTEPVPMPVAGDAGSLQRHRERLSPKALRTPGLCASCHRGFLGRHTGLDHHLTGMDEPGAWRASAYGGSRSGTLERVTEQTCKDCHMRAETAQKSDVSLKQGSLRSHRFAGGHTALAAVSGDRRQLAANLEQLQGVVRVDVPVVFVNQKQQASDDPLALRAGDKLAVDVTLKNQSVGHTFPGGVKDLQDSWLELSVRDAQGRLVAQAGEQQAKREDPSAYVLRALLVDAGGKAETRHLVTHFGSVAYDHTVPALGARSVRYAFTLPAGVVAPLTVSARLQHRRHRLDMREQACRATRSERGRAFMQAAKQLKLAPLDGCAPEPVTLLGKVELQLGAAETATPRWQRLYEHALGMSLAVTDQLDQARYSADRALAELSAQAGADSWNLAMVAVLQGRIAARQGRLADALAAAARAEAWVGSQPAIERVRGEAYAQVWRFPEAAEAFAKVTVRSPFDTAAFRELARTRMSARDARGALTAAQLGLGLQPRDEGLLRCQALALEAEHASDAQLARDAFLFYREPDDANASRLSCDKQLAQCARDRMGVVTIEVEAPRPVR
jgi:tetratricopeptide (TPR) repeat protein